MDSTPCPLHLYPIPSHPVTTTTVPFNAEYWFHIDTHDAPCAVGQSLTVKRRNGFPHPTSSPLHEAAPFLFRRYLIIPRTNGYNIVLSYRRVIARPSNALTNIPHPAAYVSPARDRLTLLVTTRHHTTSYQRLQCRTIP